ncbi:phage minor head protein [Pseudactinotalea sp. Z1732]|uniref:phage minor head protein n=1 Tax=Pseudactinotalea sp. Z1732 TaxID=3413026 RepID=UPI003C7E3BDA
MRPTVAINARTLRVERELNAFLQTVEDQAVRDIVESWSNAWDAVAAEVDAATLELTQAAQGGRVTRTQVLRSHRAQAALAVMGEALEDLAARTGFTVTSRLAQVVEAATVAEVDMIATQLTGTRRTELRAALVRADASQIAAMVERATGQITSTALPLGPEATAAVRRELLRGITVGENPRQAARRMLRGVEDQFLGGANRALVIARTELLDAARAAQRWADEANAEVLAGWTWTAHLDPLTCRSCIANHGTLHPIEEPGPIDHQQGRCARVPKTKTWAELGFEGIPDPPDTTPDAEAWFAGLSESQQRDILGDNGYAAWQAGDYPMDAWTRRRTTDGWRDSMVPTRPPAAA